MLITQDAEGHTRAGYAGKFDGSRETLVTLRVIVLQADLQFDGLKEVSLLCLGRVFEEFFNVRADAGD